MSSKTKFMDLMNLELNGKNTIIHPKLLDISKDFGQLNMKCLLPFHKKFKITSWPKVKKKLKMSNFSNPEFYGD